MFRDMGSVSEAEADRLFQASVPWLERMLADRSYVGWFALHGGEIVAGGGIFLRDLGPTPGCCEGGRGGHIANIYTAPAYRRLGLARSLMDLILTWAKSEKLDRITLSASTEGKPLYEALGFTATAEMQLR